MPVQDKDVAVCQRQLPRNGRVVTCVTRRRDLGVACRSEFDLIIALVTADYPCRGDVWLFSLAGLQRDHYRLWANWLPVPHPFSISGSVR